jgi:hypothetical protein
MRSFLKKKKEKGNNQKETTGYVSPFFESLFIKNNKKTNPGPAWIF